MSRLIAEKEKEKGQIIPKDAFGETISVAQLDSTSAGDSELDEDDVLVQTDSVDASMTEGDSELTQKDDILAQTAANSQNRKHFQAEKTPTLSNLITGLHFACIPLPQGRGSENTDLVRKNTFWLDFCRPAKARISSISKTSFRTSSQWTISGFFPEFYFYFVASFSKLSDENRAYCLFKREEFVSLFLGEEEDINRAVYSVEQDFSEKFRSCLDSQEHIQEPIVETKFKELIIPHIQPHTIAVRETKLASAALEGDLVPYVYFLMAYEHGHDYIWAMVAKCFARYATIRKHIDLFSEAFSRWSTEKNFNILDCIDKFVDELIDEGILSQEMDQKRKNSTRDIFSGLNLADESITSFIGNDEVSNGREHPEKETQNQQ
ncbi:hypothetical protein HF325_001278 [Metschnikowia pulcherrima]|uniref:Uncharacterized protein n=1 Tax=Metschnikowia pulcherrima TaxID=27326 RepID=A0A8H7GU84_9ASCO|nr:hypothetical protein HF325_001278 [Metschnikowia pulcherrima]